MSYNDLENQELSAELLLATYHPDIDDWTVEYGSFFSRNYSGDLKSCDANQHQISLSRNGLYDILPEKIFFNPEELRFKESRDLAIHLSELYEEEKNIKAYFRPFDSFFFNRSLAVNNSVSRILDNKTKLMLRLLFDYDIEAETNPYVKLMAPMLLNVTDIRSDLKLIASILSSILQCKVECKKPRQDKLLFVIHKLNLTRAEYLDFMEALEPLFDFVLYWFIPMEMECDYKVKDYEQPFILSDQALVLDYNTQI